ncbi:MAG: glutamine synthetase family protein [Ostreibacterium sp.]
MASKNTGEKIDSLYVTVCDLNGVLRAKRIPIKNKQKALNGEIRMPLSVVGVDIWGADIASDGGVFNNGDLDGICRPTDRSAIVVKEQSTRTIIPLWMYTEDGKPYACDSRQALATVVKRYEEKGLTPVVATELEFYLMDANTKTPQAPISPTNKKRLAHNAILSLDELEAFESFFNEVYKICEEQNIPADAAISENGLGQFEINLLHVDNPLKAADDAVFFKRIVKSVARKHEMIASFMAKPYGEESGNGFHVHFSLLDKKGCNVFDDGSETGSNRLKYAVNGLINAMPESMLIFAPHYNSYRRFQSGSHASTTAGWGYENRTTAIRIPGGDMKARRIEHRVAGADANPYLVLASILGSALEGIEKEELPIEPIHGSAYDTHLKPLPNHWSDALAAFSEASILRKVLNDTLCDLLLACKKQEMDKFSREVSDFEYQSYLEVV